ncbi:MAG: hypothetical protein HOP19_11940 [Acidobacteria bacterium]|nr:hypothetical protein [Acidobacteriota bacterium]
MIAQATAKISALEAEAAANLFLSDHLPDRYCADDPQYDAITQVWRIPVILAYPFIGSLGAVGELTVNPFSKAVVSHTPIDQMRQRGQALYQQNREAIEAAFLSAGNA